MPQKPPTADTGKPETPAYSFHDFGLALLVIGTIIMPLVTIVYGNGDWRMWVLLAAGVAILSVIAARDERFKTPDA